MFTKHESMMPKMTSAARPSYLSPMGRGEETVRIDSLDPLGEPVPVGRVRGGRLHLSSPSGFSLMEVLVGVMILGIVYATLFGLMSGSLKNVNRIEQRELVVRYGEMKLNELIIRARDGELRQVLSGRFDDRYSWQARLETYDTGEDTPKSSPYFLVRIRLSVLWAGSSRFSQYDLETLTWVPKPRQVV
jgi:general secretion pathway protein I